MLLPSTILIAEDEPMVLRVLEFKLRKDGYTVLTASDGREASKKIQSENIDLLITDLTLPFVSGLEVISVAKKKLQKKIPVIVLTDMDSEAVMMEALEAGADDFLTKPFSPNELSIRVKKLLKEYLQQSSRLLKTFLLVISIFLFSEIKLSAQQKSANNDSLFKKAQEYAFNGKRNEAREICRNILEKNSDNYKVRILMARTFSWDKNFDTARIELKKVLDIKPAQQDAIDALLDVELWSSHYEEAVKIADNAFTYFPDNPNFLIKKAKALDKLGRYTEALDALRKVTHPSPKESDGKKKKRTATSQQIAEAMQMNDAIKLKTMKNGIGAIYNYESFSDIYSPRHLLQIEGKRKFGWGTFIARVNMAKKFGKTGTLFEVDAYPKLGNGMYLYLNGGASSSAIFPLLRSGIELYKKLPRSFEMSLGMRYLDFGNNAIFIYTGSLAKYYGNYWLSLRTFVVPKEIGVSHSFILFIRRYLGSADNYLTLSVNYGFSPDDRKVIVGANPYLLRSQKVSISFQKSIKRNFLLTGAFHSGRQELSFKKGNYISTYMIETGLRYRF